MTIGVGMVGAGNWGKNLIRTFSQLSGCDIKALCDLDQARLRPYSKSHTDARLTTRYQELLDVPGLDAVVIGSSAVTHYDFAKAALAAGLHVFVEKPMALSLRDAEELVSLASKNSKILMVGHLLEYHPAVTKLKQIITSGELGEIYYTYAQRTNLGIIKKDENALWSFGPHDISVILCLLQEEPETVTARGECYLQPGIQDVVFVNLQFKSRKMAQVQLSWLDPHKVRKLTIVGSRKMVVFDDMDSAEKIKIYDKGVDAPKTYENYGESLNIRLGDIHIPRVDYSEPLRIECQHFLDCISSGRQPLTDAQDGLRVIRVLAAAQESLDKGGVPVECGR